METERLARKFLLDGGLTVNEVPCASLDICQWRNILSFGGEVEEAGQVSLGNWKS